MAVNQTTLDWDLSRNIYFVWPRDYWSHSNTLISGWVRWMWYNYTGIKSCQLTLIDNYSISVSPHLFTTDTNCIFFLVCWLLLLPTKNPSNQHCHLLKPVEVDIHVDHGDHVERVEHEEHVNHQEPLEHPEPDCGMFGVGPHLNRDESTADWVRIVVGCVYVGI